MQPIPSLINPADPEFQANVEFHRGLAQQLCERLALVREGGGARYRQSHKAQGKFYARDQIDYLLDPGAPFLEIVPMAAWGMYEGAAPGAGIVAGIGRVSGREAMIIANDATVKGGSYYPMTVKKHLRAQQIA